MKVYIAAPLFNEFEKNRNVEISEYLNSVGISTYLPQKDGGLAFDLIKNGENKEKARKAMFEGDVNAIKDCDAILCILDGRVPDEGLCVELGMAYVLGKKRIGYKTDKRSLDEFGVNLMIEGCLEKIVSTKDELRNCFI